MIEEDDDCRPNTVEVCVNSTGQIEKPIPAKLLCPDKGDRKCIAKHMINPRISAVWSTTKQIAPFSSTPHVQEVHAKAEFVHLTPGLLGLGVLFNCHA